MRFIHLSDLHIGRQLHQYNLKEDQEHILGEVVEYARMLRPDAIVIAGDVYDKSVPSAEAVGIFDWFLTALSALKPEIPILIISGNHDSAQRIDYASGILGQKGIYIAGKLPQNQEEFLKKVTLQDEYGEVDFYLLPFLKPGYVRTVFDGEMPESYSKAVQMLLERELVDTTKRNVIVTHQFYTGAGQNTETCDSEIFSVGGIDNVDVTPLLRFDYAALGHLHSAQKVGRESVRYPGTLLKYSVSECNQTKSLHLVTLKEKGTPVEVETYPLHPLRDVKKFRGTLKELLKTVPEEAKEDYVSITLTDETDPYRPKEQLEKELENREKEIYSLKHDLIDARMEKDNLLKRILEVRMDNSRTRQKLMKDAEVVRMASPLEIFGDFFQEMQGRALNAEEQQVMNKIAEEMEEE